MTRAPTTITITTEDPALIDAMQAAWAGEGVTTLSGVEWRVVEVQIEIGRRSIYEQSTMRAKVRLMEMLRAGHDWQSERTQAIGNTRQLEHRQ